MMCQGELQKLKNAPPVFVTAPQQIQETPQYVPMLNPLQSTKAKVSTSTSGTFYKSSAFQGVQLVTERLFDNLEKPILLSQEELFAEGKITQITNPNSESLKCLRDTMFEWDEYKKASPDKLFRGDTPEGLAGILKKNGISGQVVKTFFDTAKDKADEDEDLAVLNDTVITFGRFVSTSTDENESSYVGPRSIKWHFYGSGIESLGRDIEGGYSSEKEIALPPGVMVKITGSKSKTWTKGNDTKYVITITAEVLDDASKFNTFKSFFTDNKDYIGKMLE